MKEKSLSITILFIFGWVISCSDTIGILPVDKREENIKEIEAQLQSLYSKAINPIYLDFSTKLNLLKQEASVLKTENNANQLKIIQQLWVSTATLWRKAELFNIGPISSSYIFFKINRWPIDASRINTYIDETKTIDQNFISGIGSSSKGLASLEYLLFATTFTHDENDSNKIDYINAVIEELQIDIDTTIGLWTNYKDSFENSTEIGISGGQNRIHNAIISLLENIIISKLGKPIEYVDFDPVSYLEASSSEQSLEFIKANFEIIKFCFVMDNGFNSYLNKIEEEELQIKLTKELDTCENLLNSFEFSIKEIVLTKEMDNLEALKEGFTSLLKIIKIDLANTLGNTITFSDNDGD